MSIYTSLISLVTPEIAVMITHGATSDDKVGIITTLWFPRTPTWLPLPLPPDHSKPNVFIFVVQTLQESLQIELCKQGRSVDRGEVRIQSLAAFPGLEPGEVTVRQAGVLRIHQEEVTIGAVD